MLKTRVMLKLASMLAVGGTVMTGGCLPENFWAAKWGEVLNRTIIWGISSFIPGLNNGNF